MMARIVLTAMALMLAAGSTAAGSRLLATGGATQFEGAAGGGIVPWAVIAGYGDRGEWGGDISASHLWLKDFQLETVGLAAGFHDRLELSFARQTLDVEPLDLSIRQDVFGAKVRLTGNLIYGNAPQVSLGVQHKRNRDAAVPTLLGAHDDSGTDLYASAAKLFLNGFMGRNVFINGTVRWSDANQAGLLGFGDAGGSDPRLLLEASAGIFLDRHWIVGAEYRQKPDRLATVEEHDWYDLFLGWFPDKRVGLVAAYAGMGDIAGLPDQEGWYLSLQISYQGEQ